MDAIAEPPPLLADLDAFDLRTELAHGLSLSDGLRVDVIDENTLMVVGTDRIPSLRGIYLATGRLVSLSRSAITKLWWAERQTGSHGYGQRRVAVMSDLDDDLAWVRRRLDP